MKAVQIDVGWPIVCNWIQCNFLSGYFGNCYRLSTGSQVLILLLSGRGRRRIVLWRRASPGDLLLIFWLCLIILWRFSVWWDCSRCWDLGRSEVAHSTATYPTTTAIELLSLLLLTPISLTWYCCSGSACVISKNGTLKLMLASVASFVSSHTAIVELLLSHAKVSSVSCWWRIKRHGLVMIVVVVGLLMLLKVTHLLRLGRRYSVAITKQRVQRVVLLWLLLVATADGFDICGIVAPCRCRWVILPKLLYLFAMTWRLHQVCCTCAWSFICRCDSPLLLLYMMASGWTCCIRTHRRKCFVIYSTAGCFYGNHSCHWSYWLLLLELNSGHG